MKTKNVALLFVAFMWIGTLALAGQDTSRILKAGKEGKFTLDEKTQVGDVTLQSGTPYVIQHRVIDGVHYVRFQEAFTGNTETVQLKPTDLGVMKCTVEPLSKKAGETRIFTEKRSDGLHITKVEVAGEDVAHVF
jgi:hypothetical protein